MMDIKNMEALRDNVLVEGIKEEMRGGVYVGITTDDKPEQGVIIKVGPGRVTDEGILVPTVVKPGMIVLFNEHTTTKFNVNGKTVYMLKEEDIVCYGNKENRKGKEDRNLQRKVK